MIAVGRSYRVSSPPSFPDYESKISSFMPVVATGSEYARCCGVVKIVCLNVTAEECGYAERLSKIASG